MSTRKKDANLNPRFTSQMWENDELDPYQVFQVVHKKCLLLRVQVYSGKNISKGCRSLCIFKPNPYLILELKDTPNEKKMTPVVKSSCNPEWNVSFQFIVDSSNMTELCIKLMDKKILCDRKIGKTIFRIKELKLDKEKSILAEFQDGSKVTIMLSLVKSYEHDLRYSLALSNEELDFARNRRIKIFDGMKAFLGPEDAPKEVKEVPVVAVLLSGGGIRALIACCGVFKALHESGFLDCTMYVAGLSGSCWYLTYLYTHPAFPDVGPGELIPEIREKLAMKSTRVLLPRNMYNYLKHLLTKTIAGQSVTFADFYGHILGQKLLGERKHLKLSQLKEKLIAYTVPMPLFTCVIAKKNVSARVFQEYVEFSPYEVGLPKYGAFMETEKFGSKFYVGKIIQKHEELPLHYLIGVWGSAFGILIKRLVEDDLKSVSDTSNKEKIQELGRNLDGNFNIQNLKYEEDTELNEILYSADSESGIRFEDDDRKKYLKNQPLKTILVKGNADIQDNTSSSENSSVTNETQEGMSENFLKRFLKKNKNENMQLKGKKKVTLIETAEIIDETSFFSNEREAAATDRSSDSESDLTDISFSNIDIEFDRSYEHDSRTPIKESEAFVNEGFWQRLMKQIVSIKCIGGTRAGRAGEVFNPLRGLNLTHTYPFSPFNDKNDHDTDFQGNEELIESNAKKIFLVDAGLSFNSPFPLLLRPQRAVDVFISFDYSTRSEDFHDSFQELILAEKWAVKNKINFPPVREIVQKYYRQPMREIYVFKHPRKQDCPIVVHCIIFNGLFREYKEPNVKRETKEEFEFADFKIFSDPENPYSIYKYTYTPRKFDRLCKLMEFNTSNGMKIFRMVLKYAVKRKRKQISGNVKSNK